MEEVFSSKFQVFSGDRQCSRSLPLKTEHLKLETFHAPTAVRPDRPFANAAARFKVTAATGDFTVLAAFFNASALSAFSHVMSGSFLPKWP
jgi:hypothetical protein